MIKYKNLPKANAGLRKGHISLPRQSKRLKNTFKIKTGCKCAPLGQKKPFQSRQGGGKEQTSPCYMTQWKIKGPLDGPNQMDSAEAAAMVRNENN